MSAEPIRLLDRADLSEAERAALDVGRAVPPVDYDVASGEARFRARLAALAAAGAAAGAAGAAAGPTVRAGSKALFAKLGFKIFLGLAVGTVFSAAGVVVGKRLASPRAQATGVVTPALVAAPAPSRPGEPASVPAVVPAPVAQAVAPAQVPSSDPESGRHEPFHVGRPHASSIPSKKAPTTELPLDPAQGAPNVDSEQAPPMVSTATAAAPVDAHPVAQPPVAQPPVAQPPQPATAPPPPQTAPQQPAPPEPLSEIRAVAMARGLVDRDPEAALALLEKTARAYPTGYFLEERQALTVLALDRAGHHAAARQAAQAFLRAYPNGPFSDRVRTIATP